MTDEIINCIKGVLTEHELMIVKEALESRTPTPTAKLNIGEGIYMEVCPVCNAPIDDNGSDLYCRKCGQALKWEVKAE